MLTKEETEALLLVRILACAESCNSFHINHVSGQIRALASVLKDGESPPSFGDDIGEVLDWVGIPYTRDGAYIHWHTEWLESRGFVVTHDPDGDETKDEIDHPKFKKSW